jgi:hypothetical protein
MRIHYYNIASVDLALGCHTGCNAPSRSIRRLSLECVEKGIGRKDLPSNRINGISRMVLAPVA